MSKTGCTLTAVYVKGIEQGRREEAANLINRMLTKRFGTLSSPLQKSIVELPTVSLEALGEAMFDFKDLGELDQWLESV